MKYYFIWPVCIVANHGRLPRKPDAHCCKDNWTTGNYQSPLHCSNAPSTLPIHVHQGGVLALCKEALATSGSSTSVEVDGVDSRMVWLKSLQGGRGTVIRFKCGVKWGPYKWPQINVGKKGLKTLYLWGLFFSHVITTGFWPHLVG